MDHGTLRLLGAGAALGDLDHAERLAYDAHVRVCRSCGRLAGELDGTLADLALMAPRIVPPSTLRAAVIGALHTGDIEAQDSTHRAAVVPSRARRSPWVPALLGLAAVLAVLVVGLGAWSTRLRDEAATAQSRVELQAAAMAVVADPAHRSAELAAEPLAPAANAVVVWRPGTTDAYIMADGLPPTPNGMVYQLWNADQAGVHPLGTFRYDGGGPFLASFGVDLDGSAAAMITLEPATGASGGPGAQVVFGELSSGTDPTR